MEHYNREKQQERGTKTIMESKYMPLTAFAACCPSNVKQTQISVKTWPMVLYMWSAKQYVIYPFLRCQERGKPIIACRQTKKPFDSLQKAENVGQHCQHGHTVAPSDDQRSLYVYVCMYTYIYTSLLSLAKSAHKQST
jgi:hypothetical protein